ncbi:MAG: hypothetical protein HC876_09080 [Chloroflexaceae bacterium]|nr:hypothetical protein [Chloroflexaceae bacterium]
MAELAAQVAQQAHSNSPYRDLLDWRQRFDRLHLLRRDGVAGLALRADPPHIDALYQIWLCYELADLLRARGLLDNLDTNPAALTVRFRWPAEQPCTYELRYRQPVLEPLDVLDTPHGLVFAEHLPDLRLPLVLHRIRPAPEAVLHNGIRYWREPGLLLVASAAVPALAPVLADLALLEGWQALVLGAARQMPHCHCLRITCRLPWATLSHRPTPTLPPCWM